MAYAEESTLDKREKHRGQHVEVVDALIDLQAQREKQGKTEGLEEIDEKPVLPLKCFKRAALQQVLSGLDDAMELQDYEYDGLDLPMLATEVNEELVGRALDFCDSVSSSSGGTCLRLAHNDLGSGGDMEQRLFDLKKEREQREREKAFWEKKKRDSSKEKDFGGAAKMRNAGEAGIATTVVRLADIDAELGELSQKQESVPWNVFFVGWEGRNRNSIRCLDLSNCGLHATGVTMLTSVVLDMEHRGDGAKVTRLILDGNDMGDIGMGSLASFVRLSTCIEAVHLRNVGITDQGMGEIVAGLVTNKTLALLDLRDNGLCTPAVCKEIVAGMRRFNTKTRILLS